MDFIYFLGRFHVLALHLPVGIICVVVVMEFIARKERFAHYLQSTNYLWLAATLSAFLTVGLGMMHRTEGGFEGPAMASHALWGIGTAFFSLGIFLLRIFSIQAYSKLQAVTGIWMLVMVTMTGHYGGNLTHGSTYLLAYAPKPFQSMAGFEPREPVTDIRQADVFLDVVNPLLQSRCESCHNNNKFRGQLSLASYELMLQGGESGPAIVAGDIASSELVRRISLSPMHDDFMPADDKIPLTEGQVSLITWWVEQGAPTAVLMVELEPEAEILAVANEFLGLSNLDELNQVNNVVAAAESDIAKARSLGFLIRKLSQDSNLLELDISVQGGDITQDHIDAINSLVPQIVKLSLKNTALTDEEFILINPIPNLITLNIAETDLSDQSFIALQQFPVLEVLNIYGNTSMSTQGLAVFNENASVERIYAWGISE